MHLQQSVDGLAVLLPHDVALLGKTGQVSWKLPERVKELHETPHGYLCVGTPYYDFYGEKGNLSLLDEKGLLLHGPTAAPSADGVCPIGKVAITGDFRWLVGLGQDNAIFVWDVLGGTSCAHSAAEALAAANGQGSLSASDDSSRRA
jgi:hypothetical protein